MRVEVVYDGLKRVILVNLVAVADGVADGQLQPHVALLQLVGLGLQLHHGQGMGAGGGLEVRVEQRVHEGALPQTGLADTENVEDESILHALVHQLVGEAVKSNVPCQLEVAQEIVDLEMMNEVSRKYVNGHKHISLFHKKHSLGSLVHARNIKRKRLRCLVCTECVTRVHTVSTETMFSVVLFYFWTGWKVVLDSLNAFN